MPKFHASREIIKALESKGFDFVSQRGSHAKYQKRSRVRSFVVIVPMSRKEIPHGTFRSIVRQSGSRVEDFD